MKRSVRILLFLASGVGLAWALHLAGVITLPFFKGSSSAQMTRGGGPLRREEAIPVLTTPLRRESVPVIIESVGTAQASASVVVRPQVDGKLVEVLFQEGQRVKKGDVLARIDATTFKAQYDQAAAKKAQNEALLDNARRDLERYQRLARDSFGSQQQADTQRTQVAQLEAQLQLDQAAIDNARAVLDYATIRAPIDGRTGIRAVDEGNIVRGSDPSGVVSIAQMTPIALLFNLPQQQLQQVRTAFLEGSVPVEVVDGDGKRVIGQGQIAVIDNQIDQATGTVRVKALFGNEDAVLWPGQFVNMRIEAERLKDVLVVPAAAVQRGPNGPYVYVFKDGKAVLTQIDVGRQTAEIAVISGGLSLPADIITTGFSRLDDGARVIVAKGEGAVDTKPPAPQK